MAQSYDYNGIKIFNDNKEGIYYIYIDRRKIHFPTDKEAEEYIDENIIEKEKEDVYVPDLYEQFVIYCNKLPCRCFIENKLATTNENVLKKFIEQFKKLHDVDIQYDINILGGEYFYIIKRVLTNK